MRRLLLVCLLGGCYQPSTDSCYYACATQGEPCPNGLECVAGKMCATPGTSSCPPPGGDSMMMNDTVPLIDSPPPLCNNNIPAAGEICYGTALVFNGQGGPADGVLADRNGDSRLDLIYLTGNGLVTHANTGTALATATSLGMPAPDLRAMRPAQLNADMKAELLIASSSDLQSWAYSMGNDFTLTSRYTGGITLVGTFEYGKMTDSPFGDVVILDGNTIKVFAIISESAAQPISTISGVATPQSKLAVGHLNPTTDMRIDVVLVSQVGITAFIGSAAGLSGSGTTLPISSPVGGVRIGNVDGTGDGDIVYVVQSQVSEPMGQIGVLRNMGNGVFSAPEITMVPNLGGALEVADLDNDGRADVLAVRTGSSKALLVYRGRADGKLEPAVEFPLSGVSALIAAQISARGSFNGDTVPDIVVTDPQGNTVYVLPSTP